MQNFGAKSHIKTNYLKKILHCLGFVWGAFLQSVPIYLRPIAFFSFSRVKSGSLTIKQRRLCGVVLRVRVWQV